MIEPHLGVYRRQIVEVRQTTYTAGAVAANIIQTLVPMVTVVEAFRRVVTNAPTGTYANQTLYYMQSEIQQWYAAEQKAWQRNENYQKGRLRNGLGKRVAQLEERCRGALEATASELRARDQERNRHYNAGTSGPP